MLVDISLSNGILLEGIAQFITLKFSDNRNLTIVNKYAARTFNERVLMWKRLSEASFDTTHVIIRGDFNHLEKTDRRGKAGQHLMLKKKGGLLAPYDASVWASGRLEAGQLSKNVQEGIHF
jgi:hypothetical protein